jgi:hypothetical protein
MKRSCQHCGELIVGNTYRVTSEEDNVTLLNLVVCSLCSMEAKRLGLRGGNQYQHQTLFVAKSRESPFATWNLVAALGSLTGTLAGYSA